MILSKLRCDMSIVWHYATALGFMGLAETWEVRPSVKDVPPSELPVAWFSSNPMLERTILEMVWKRTDGSVLRPKNADEYRILGMGLYRVGTRSDQLLRYIDLLKKAKIGFGRRRILERAAKDVGASPFEWYGSLSSVPILDDALIQTFNGKQWVVLPRHSAKAYILAEQEVVTPLLMAMIGSSREDRPPSKMERLV